MMSYNATITMFHANVSECLYCNDADITMDFDLLDDVEMFKIAHAIYDNIRNKSAKHSSLTITNTENKDYFKVILEYLNLYLTPVIILVGYLRKFDLIPCLLFDLPSPSLFQCIPGIFSSS